MPSPIIPSQFGDAVPSANADFCDRFSKWLNVPKLLFDLFSWMFNSNGTLSSAFAVEIATYTAPTGSLLFSASASAGDGYLLCDGSAVSRAAYPSLFTAIGTRYGAGDNSTTFNLPDGRGRSLMGAGAGTGLTFRDINVKYVGEESHALTAEENGPHTHTYGGYDTSGRSPGSGGQILPHVPVTTDSGSSGSGTPHNTVHPCLIAFLFIKI